MESKRGSNLGVRKLGSARPDLTCNPIHADNPARGKAPDLMGFGIRTAPGNSGV